ncbi:MAG: ParB/RepB/Spo0J family partition protein [Firmicutes bacterium]|nr:ParB/RepB/Spo0J family partition protein [Bacillota bacterium]
MAAKRITGLGSGLGSLGLQEISNSVTVDAASNDKVYTIDINTITPSKDQPRRNFDDEALNELADSIRQIGIIQPITVKSVDDHYVIIAGERRWRAARKAGVTEIPVIIKNDLSDLEVLEIQLIENIQREDLSPLEEALTYKKFSDEFNLNQEAIAAKVGKSRAAVANSMRLLNLDKRVQTFLDENRLSSGHCRALLAITDKDLQFETAERVIDEGYSVRQTEELVKKVNEAAAAGEEEKVISTMKNPKEARIYLDLAKDLKSILGTKVNIKNLKNNTGKIVIEYYSDDELDRIVGMIRKIQ